MNVERTTVGLSRIKGRHMEEKMLQRVFSVIRRTNGVSGFDGYLQSLQGLDSAGAPTREEARRDYLAARRRGQYRYDGLY